MAPHGACGFMQSKVQSSEVSPKVRGISQNSEHFMRIVGPKKCSEFEELCTGTAEEVLYSLCFGSEGSGAKQCS